MRQDAETTTLACNPRAAADLLRALAHPTRLTILCRLLDGELSVSGFEAELGLRQPSLSQQLGLLREAGLVTTRREAKSVVYGLADHRLGRLIGALRAFLGGEAEAAPPQAAAAVPLQPMVAAATSPRPPARPVRPAPAATGECGVFAVAGWPAARGGKTNEPRG
jgi:ArsR family transcriptional regulator